MLIKVIHILVAKEKHIPLDIKIMLDPLVIHKQCY